MYYRQCSIFIRKSFFLRQVVHGQVLDKSDFGVRWGYGLAVGSANP
jgi:hypothetical protein